MDKKKLMANFGIKNWAENQRMNKVVPKPATAS